ncbi:hypothetical protein [Aquamicrobium zhengzhouense]|uniref:Uncharacterized protein n=1 Tax=Aquamicrobium zhengzhouense TaxID=2781738 RepID=A0ABS0SB75_9HYPH|nr:hypothetical protein [Aquamicrobium zhengzhouense]MBI1619961.1 hypothetical protein [Aquamicrobium zhengzhouense]
MAKASRDQIGAAPLFPAPFGGKPINKCFTAATRGHIFNFAFAATKDSGNPAKG